MKSGKNIFGPLKQTLLPAAGILCLVLVLLSPPRAFAQCEPGGVPEAAATAVDATQTAAVTTMTTTLKSVYMAEEEAAKEALLSALWFMDKSIFDILEWFWGSWDDALKKMSIQIHSSIIDQTRQIGSNEDASGVARTALMQQAEKFDGHQLYETNAQGCQFDTMATHMARGKGVSEALVNGYAVDFNRIGNNSAKSAAATGNAALQQSRWQSYQTKFCDKDSNNGAAGCTADLAAANRHILPSKTIFSKETIDVTDADTREALNQLLFNITGYEPADPMADGALGSATGLEQRQENREYVAQMDAVGALAYSVVAERLPGDESLEIQALRQKLGVTDASNHPSLREIRQAMVEQVSDPNYYQELYDGAATLPQKELYLKAYNLLLLNEILTKQEKISNAYAIETANMLNKNTHSRHGAVSSAPLKP